MFERNKNKKGEGREVDVTATASRARPVARGSQVGAVIGPGIRIKGEVTGEETLIIQGHIEGTVDLGEQELIIGEHGRIFADLHSRVVRVDGQVTGNITGDDLVSVMSRGNVKGNIVAPRVTLEDGAQFKGSIDMDPGAAPAPVAEPVPAADEPGEPDFKQHGKA